MKARLLVVGMVILALIPSAYFYRAYTQEKYRTEHPDEAAKADAQAVISEVGKFMVLPDETPTVARVSDVSKLTDQPFFANAKNGDMLLIFTQAKKAILYRQSAHKIIEVAPLNLGSTAPATPSSQVSSARVMILNGSGVTGAAAKYEKELTAKVPYAVVIGTDTANKHDYAKTMLVDVTGKKPVQANDMAQKLGIAISALPKGEATPSADFLIIVGADTSR